MDKSRRLIPAVKALSLLGLAGLLPLPSMSFAAEPAPPLSLAAIIQEVKERNPELGASRERSTAMAAMPAQVRALDDPTLSYEAWNAPDSFRVDRADNNIFKLSQRLPFPGKRALAGEVATHAAEQSAHEAADVELEVVAAVKRAYYDLWQGYERLTVLTREKALLERLTHVVEERYGTGDAPQADVLRAQVELTHLVVQIQTEQLTIESARAELGALVSRGKEGLRGRPETPNPPKLDASTEELVARALAQRPDVSAQDAAIARATSAVALARRDRYPDFEVSVGRFVNSDASDGFGAMVAVTLPVFNGAKYDAGVDEAAARLRAAEADRRRLEDKLRREVEQAYLRAKTALLRYELFTKTHVPQTEQALRVTESGYQTGSVPFLDLIDTRRSIESVHLEHVMAQAEFEKAYADLERVVGTELPRSPGPAASERKRGQHE